MGWGGGGGLFTHLSQSPRGRTCSDGDEGMQSFQPESPFWWRR